MKHVGMLAGGTGLTPMLQAQETLFLFISSVLQVVQAALRDSGDTCNFYLPGSRAMLA